MILQHNRIYKYMYMRPFLLLLVLLLAGCGQPDKPTISLYLAVQRGDIDQIERHIHWGTDINQLDPDGHQPLHVASNYGRIVVVRTLLKHGADINARDKQGHTALHYAILSGRTQLADLLLENNAELDASSLLLTAARQGNQDRDVVNYLVKHGANTEQTDDNGDTPLLITVRTDNHRLLRHLIARGANVNARDAEGKSALQIANELQFQEIADQLRRNGAVIQ